ncbi:dCTP deaminase [Planctobacterium marinum]
MSRELLSEIKGQRVKSLNTLLVSLKEHQVDPRFNPVFEFISKEINDAERQDSCLFSTITLLSKVEVYSQFVRMLKSAYDSSPFQWTLPLIKECYKRLNIDHENRIIILYHEQDSLNFNVVVDLFSQLDSDNFDGYDGKLPCIDLITIPYEIEDEFALMSLIGHEIGHVFCRVYESHQVSTKLKTVFLNELSVEQDKLKGGESASVNERQIELFNYIDNLGNEKESKRSKMLKDLTSQIEEFIADTIGAFLFGPAFDFYCIKFLLPLDSHVIESTGTHPPSDERIHTALKRMEGYRTMVSEKSGLKTPLDTMVKLSKDGVETCEVEKSDETDGLHLKLLKCIDILKEELKPVEKFDVANFNQWNAVRQEMNNFRPAFEDSNDELVRVIGPVEALVGGVIYYYGKCYENNDHLIWENKEFSEESDSKVELIRNKLFEHLKYSISLYDFIISSRKRVDFDASVKKLDETLWQLRGFKKDIRSTVPFNVTPTINPSKQYSSTSVDLRLGPTFYVHSTSKYTHLNPKPTNWTANSDEKQKCLQGFEKTESVMSQSVESFYRKYYVPPKGDFILHPHQFVLAATLEYITLPHEYYALVLGRSSWGRLGLNIATATSVQAGFRGCLTLELRNLGETPLPLTVGSRIAQLCLVPLVIQDYGPGYAYGANKYIGPVGPEIPKIHLDNDWDILIDR